MKLDQKVIGLESATLLEELCKKKKVKLPQSENVWAWSLMTGKLTLWSREYAIRVGAKIEYDAHDVAELGEILPETILHKKRVTGERGLKNFIYFMASGKRYCTYSRDAFATDSIKYIDGETEAEARGKMLIYLLENDLFTPQK